ncbi:class I SAM-dependent methyltransferase [Candidatus Micrarchaeota archaeon]|nr:class I SAM-dependent methyltransferase [Candidatus Micrarchaeota archaeon]
MTSRHTKRLKWALAASAQAKTVSQINREIELEESSVNERLAVAQAAAEDVLRKYGAERKKLHDSLPFEAQGRHDWHRWAPKELRALEERRKSELEGAKSHVTDLRIELANLHWRNRNELERNRMLVEKVKNARWDRNDLLMKSLARLSRLDQNPTWSPQLQAAFEENREQILKSFPGTGARSTENWFFTETPRGDLETYPRFKARPSKYLIKEKDLGLMPHLRTLAGLLLHLEAIYGKRVGGNVLRRFEFLLKKNSVKTMLDAGSGATGPLLWLARTGIPKRLGIDLFAVDVRTLKQPELKRLEQAGIKYIPADANNALEIIGKPADVILCSGVLSPGGQADFSYLGEWNGKKPRVNLPAASARSHVLAKNLVSTLSENPAAALIATSWFGSLALRRKRVGRFALVRFWQTDPSAWDSDRDRINDEVVNSNFDKYHYGKALLTGAKLAVMQKKPNSG